jgi:hypothetical protein
LHLGLPYQHRLLPFLLPLVLPRLLPFLPPLVRLCGLFVLLL